MNKYRVAYARQQRQDSEYREKTRKWNRNSYKNKRQQVLSKQQEYNARHIEKKSRMKIKALMLMGNTGCARCGFDHPAALQFHHLDPDTKEFNISTKLERINIDWDLVQNELNKCIVLCSNCHDIEHSGARYEWWEREQNNVRI